MERLKPWLAFVAIALLVASTVELQMAIDQLRLALAAPNLNDVQRQRFQARIDELSEYLPKGRRAREAPEASKPDDPGGRVALE